DGLRLEEIAGRVVDLRADRDIALGERAGFVDLIVPVLDVERDVAAVVCRPPLMPDRREQVAGVGAGRLAPSDFILAGECEEAVDAAELAPRRRGQCLFAERASTDFERRFGLVLAAAGGQEQRAAQ